MKKSKALGNTVLLVTAMIWGLAFVFQRTGMDYIGPMSFNAARHILASLALLVLIVGLDAIKRKKGELPSQTMSPEEFAAFKKNTLKGGLYCGAVLVFAASMQQLGLVSTSAGKAGFITAMYVVLVPVAGFIFLKKRTGKLQFFAVALATAGLYLLSVKEGFTIEKGDLYVMACALGYTLYILIVDKYAPVSDPVRMSFIQFAFAFVLTCIIVLFTEGPYSIYWHGPEEYFDSFRYAAVGILYCGIMSSGVGYTGQIVGQRYTDSVSASLIMCLESVFAALFGVLILDEQMSGRELLGCIIMFAAIIISQLPEPRGKASMGMPKA